MCPKAKNAGSNTENDLRYHLQKVGQSDELTHFFIEALGAEGVEFLRRRLALSGNERASSLLVTNNLSDDERRTLEITTLFNFFARRKELLTHSIGAMEAAELLGVSKQTIHDRIRDNKLIGMIEANSMRLPLFQFDPTGQNGCVNGLPEVLKEMHGSLISKINWLVSENAVFSGRAPIEVLRGGNIDEVLREARSTGVA